MCILSEHRCGQRHRIQRFRAHNSTSFASGSCAVSILSAYFTTRQVWATGITAMSTNLVTGSQHPFAPEKMLDGRFDSCLCIPTYISPFARIAIKSTYHLRSLLSTPRVGLSTMPTTSGRETKRIMALERRRSTASSGADRTTRLAWTLTTKHFPALERCASYILCCWGWLVSEGRR